MDYNFTTNSVHKIKRQETN